MRSQGAEPDLLGLVSFWRRDTRALPLWTRAEESLCEDTVKSAAHKPGGRASLGQTAGPLTGGFRSCEKWVSEV